jgi:uncharacterized protein YjbI with pentapeptide repeats
MDWFDVLQSVISGVFVGLVVFGLDLVRAKRERRLSDFRIAANWEVSKPKVSLRNFQLSNTNLSGYDLSTANFENANLAKAWLKGTNLSKANLRRTNFHAAQLVGTKINDAIAYHAVFSNSHIGREKYTEEKLKVDFSRSNLYRSLFQKAMISEALFCNTNLAYTDFSGATVKKCNFSGADLTGSNWKKVKKVEGCNWKDIKGANPDNFRTDLLKEIQRQNAN